MDLHPCNVCRRHVANNATCCPFCSAPLDRPPRRSISGLAGSAARAAVFASLAASCGGRTEAVEHAKLDDRPGVTAPVANEVVPQMTSSIRGTVTNKLTGEPLQYVYIELRNRQTRIASTKTSASGEYHFDDVAAGQYALVFDDNNAPPTERAVVVHRDRPAQLDIALPRYARTNQPMPYGAPPARRRVV